VPDAWNLSAALGGFAAVAGEAWVAGLSPAAAFAHSMLSGFVCGGVFYLLREFFFRLRGSEGLGLGDVKLAATGGVWVGWEAFPLVVTLAALVAIVWIVAAALARGWSRERKIPFAAFLGPAIWICWLYSRSGPL
jgi:leader peptidase (prepilin peptidase)/N-methyltransferase